MKTSLRQVGTMSLRIRLACFSILTTITLAVLSPASISLAAGSTNQTLVVKVVTTATTSTGVSKSSVRPLVQLPPSVTPQQFQATTLEDLLDQYPQFSWKVEVFNAQGNTALVKPATSGPISLALHGKAKIRAKKKQAAAPVKKKGGCHGIGHHCDPKTRVPVPGPGTGKKVKH